MRYLPLLLLLLALPIPTLAQRPPKLSPFDGLRWNDGSPEVKVEKTWYALESLEGLATVDILAYCKETYGGRWDKRFGEDLIEVLWGMGKKPKGTVSLKVRSLDTDEVKTLSRVRMTRAKREAIVKSRPRAGRSSGAAAAAVQRAPDRRRAPNRKYAALARRSWGKGGAFAAEAAGEDLAQLEWILEHRFSYRDMKGVDWRGALDVIHAGLGESIHPNDFHIQLRKLIALFGDGHTRARGVTRALPPGFAPCAFVDVGGRIAALGPDGRPLDAQRPWVVAIDGKSIDRWLDAAASLAADGSAQLRRRDAMMYLAWTAWLRGELGLEAKGDVALTLARTKGGGKKVVRRPLARRPAFVGLRIRDEHRRLAGGRIGYIRIKTMALDPPEVEALVARVKEYRDTEGLILDVRGNGGGNRRLLMALLPLFLRPEDGAAVVNVGAVRARSSTPMTGLLASRFMYAADHPRWSKAESAAVARLEESFRPAWKLPAGEFSAWHYLVVSPAKGFRYSKPVIVLQDADCFSATDIFLGAFKGRPGVTLMGTASSGGSGRSKSHKLAHSGLELKVSTMASFRPDGQPYDGVGIAPDVVAKPVLDDFTSGFDSVLQAAIARLRQQGD